MGRKLTVLWDERELGNSVMLFTCFCCCCCPSQCALPTQCPIWASCLQEVLQLDSFSNVKKLYRVTAWVLRFINNLDRKVHNEVLNLRRCLDRTEINASELLWLHDNQKNISQNKNYCQSEKSLALITGLLRSRGRLQNAPLPNDSTEPILLDNRHYLTELVVQDVHCNVLHNGVKQTLTHIRERFWICRRRSYVKEILSKCLICKRLMGKPLP